MRKPLMYISIAVLVIALLAASWQPKTREGYKMMPELENPISKSDLYVVLTECVNNMISHETILSTLDKSYKADIVKVDTNLSDMENIQTLLRFVKKQDIQIQKMLPNYLMNEDIDHLMDGSLFKDLAELLNKKSKYPENPLECDPDSINSAITDYKAMLSPLNCKDDKSPDKTKCMTYESSIIQLQSKLVELKAAKLSPGNTKCAPPLLPSEAEGIINGKYANALAKIVKSQSLAVSSIQNQEGAKIQNAYAMPVDTGAPPPNPLADVI